VDAEGALPVRGQALGLWRSWILTHRRSFARRLALASYAQGIGSARETGAEQAVLPDAGAPWAAAHTAARVGFDR
jgi:hypothetical protein